MLQFNRLYYLLLISLLSVANCFSNEIGEKIAWTINNIQGCHVNLVFDKLSLETPINQNPLTIRQFEVLNKTVKHFWEEHQRLSTPPIFVRILKTKGISCVYHVVYFKKELTIYNTEFIRSLKTVGYNSICFSRS